MTDDIIALVVLGTLLVINTFSALCFIRFRKEQWQQKDTENKVFWFLWMLFIGWIYWLIDGINKLRKKH